MIWETDEACVEAREKVCDLHWAYLEQHSNDPKGEDDVLHGKLSAYARAVAVACLKDVLHGYAGTATAEEVRARAERMLAELGGAE